MTILFGSSIGMGREKDIPKRWAWRSKFDRNQRAFLIHLRRAHDFSVDLVFGDGILDSDLGAFADPFLENDHGPAGADRMRVTRQHFAGYVNDHGHAHQNALRAAALLRSGLARGRRPRGRMRHRGLQTVRRRLYSHSSRPQKSMAGATSSTPYSQPPSGRSSLFQTITAALLALMGTLVSATRCSGGRLCSRTKLQPYGVISRVCASTLTRLPEGKSHSSRTGTREFMRCPRRCSL